jgi:hypothetical protein
MAAFFKARRPNGLLQHPPTDSNLSRHTGQTEAGGRYGGESCVDIGTVDEAH